MNRKNLLVLSIAILFIGSLALISGAAASPNTIVYVSPPYIFDPTLIPGTQFSVDIVVENVEDLRGYQFEMSFNPEVLHGASVEVGPFLGSAGGTVYELTGLGFDNEAGKLHLTGALLWENDPVYCPDGNGVLATVTFEVVGYGGSSLKFGPNTGLQGCDGTWILHGLENVENGYFANQEVHDVKIASITCDPYGVYQGDPVFITVIVDNEGAFNESFDVTVFVERWATGEEFFIDRQAVEELSSGASITLSFVWDTTDFPYGTYYVYAEASVVPGELGETENNILDTTFGGISAPVPKSTWIDLFLHWAALAMRVVPVAAVAMVAIVIFKSLMSVKRRWPIRWHHK